MNRPDIEWESAAEEVLDGTHTTPPVDAFKLAAACGFEVRPGDTAEAESRGKLITFNAKMRLPRQHMRVSHELGHFALDRHGLEDSEDGARYVGGALLLPRRAMNRDLVETAWSIERLHARHVHASATAIAIRITQLRDAVTTVLDLAGRRRPWRRWSPWITDPRLERISRFERELAQRALDTGSEVRGDELCYAWPVVEGTFRQVIVVCELEQLSLRL